MLDATMALTAAADRFIADMVQKYFKDKKVIQEFTKPATPQQNSHIDRVAGAILSFHHGNRTADAVLFVRGFSLEI